MKKALLIISSGMILLLAQSCVKPHDKISKQVSIDTTLSSGTEYLLNLQPYGDADDVAAISKQAVNYAKSEIVNTAGIFAPVYHYQAETKTGLSDQVILTVKEGGNRGNNGHGHGCDSTVITIHFTVK
jgi:hypothetical protein